MWARDVPLFDPQFNDAGQIYDPWVWLGQLATVTRHIALSSAGIVLPLRHPLHTAKAAAPMDAVSGGRFLLGAASGVTMSVLRQGVPKKHADLVPR